MMILPASAVGFAWLTSFMSAASAFMVASPMSTRTARTAPAHMAADDDNGGGEQKSLFLTAQQAKACDECAGGTPFYAYSLDTLDKAADQCLSFPSAYGLTVRYAMKACPTAAIVQFFSSKGIHLDASSGYEVERAMAAGVPPQHISLSTQELPENFASLLDQGVLLNACSVEQLKRFAQHYQQAGTKAPPVGVRVNPGVGSGKPVGGTSATSYSKTNVGGPTSSFGIWHELVETEVKQVVQDYDLTVERIHTHIGSGSDPAIWQQVATRSLSFCQAFSTVHTLNLGGGYKVARNPETETTTDLMEIGRPVVQAFQDFAEANEGRELRLEIEPGTYLVALAGALVTTIQDKVSTKTTTTDGDDDDGHVFLKLDGGMTDVLRPSLYGAIHPMTVLAKNDGDAAAAVAAETEDVVVVGHCCESGDLMTPMPGEPEALAERSLRKAEIGDYLVLDGSGAYCSSMSTKNYNSFPEAPEVLLDKQGTPHLIRQRQSLEQITQNEVAVDLASL